MEKFPFSLCIVRTMEEINIARASVRLLRRSVFLFIFISKISTPVRLVLDASRDIVARQDSC